MLGTALLVAEFRRDDDLPRIRASWRPSSSKATHCCCAPSFLAAQARSQRTDSFAPRNETSLNRMNSFRDEPPSASSRLPPMDPAAAASCSINFLVFGPTGIVSTNPSTATKNLCDRSSIPFSSSRFMTTTTSTRSASSVGEQKTRVFSWWVPETFQNLPPTQARSTKNARPTPTPAPEVLDLHLTPRL